MTKTDQKIPLGIETLMASSYRSLLGASIAPYYSII